LAERLESFQPKFVSTAQIWSWRGSAYLLSVCSSVLSFHTPIGDPWNLDFFAVFAAFWLEREIRYYYTKGRKAPPFESLGEASYSIYLMHTHGVAFLYRFVLVAQMSAQAFWLASVILCVILTTAFYWLVERPSHWFARRVSKHFAAARSFQRINP
jgi:hypothetical protein